MAVGDFHAQFQNIAASRIFYLRNGVRIGNFARIARMFEVIEKLRRIHCENCNLPANCERHLDMLNSVIPRSAAPRNLGSLSATEQSNSLTLRAWTNKPDFCRNEGLSRDLFFLTAHGSNLVRLIYRAFRPHPATSRLFAAKRDRDPRGHWQTRSHCRLHEILRRCLPGDQQPRTHHRR